MQYTREAPNFHTHFDEQITMTENDYPTQHGNGHQPLANVHRLLAAEVVMKRITVIGPSGSGKSTLSRQLGEKLGLDVIHLDRHYWHPGWIGTPFSDWRSMVEAFVSQERWIIDGNYRSTLDVRMSASDTVVFLDLPRWVCVWRAMKRRLEYRHKPRPDMARGCKERILDPNFPAFLRGIWDYPNRARPDVLSRLSKLDDKTQVVWLRKTHEVKAFLQSPRQWSAYLPPSDEEFLGHLYNRSANS